MLFSRKQRQSLSDCRGLGSGLDGRSAVTVFGVSSVIAVEPVTVGALSSPGAVTCACGSGLRFWPELGFNLCRHWLCDRRTFRRCLLNNCKTWKFGHRNVARGGAAGSRTARDFECRLDIDPGKLRQPQAMRIAQVPFRHRECFRITSRASVASFTTVFAVASRISASGQVGDFGRGQDLGGCNDFRCHKHFRRCGHVRHCKKLRRCEAAICRLAVARGSSAVGMNGWGASTEAGVGTSGCRTSIRAAQLFWDWLSGWGSCAHWSMQACGTRIGFCRRRQCVIRSCAQPDAGRSGVFSGIIPCFTAAVCGLRHRYQPSLALNCSFCSAMISNIVSVAEARPGRLWAARNVPPVFSAIQRSCACCLFGTDRAMTWTRRSACSEFRAAAVAHKDWVRSCRGHRSGG